MTKFRLGQRVKVNMADRLRRAHTTIQTDRGHGTGREWQKYRGLREERREGIVVGLRTYTNGRVRYGGYDEPTCYTPRETLSVVLVAFAVRQRHVPFLIDDVEEA